MTRLTFCLTILLSLIAAAPTVAKEVVAAKVCGASDCRKVEDEKALLALHEGGTPTNGPAKASGFYRAKLIVKAGEEERFAFTIHLVPSAGLIRGEDGSWMPVSDQAVAEFRRMTRGLEAISAGRFGALKSPALPEARVDEVFEPAQQPAAAASDDASPWPWIAGGLAALIVLGLALYARTRDHLGLHHHSNHARAAGAQGGGARPPGV
jgi:hypothetical protein